MKKVEKIHNIGILGGTFDPVHKGHLAVAKVVIDRYQLDEILFIPAFSPPHKERKLTSFSHRVAMLEAALEDDPRMSVSIIEAERSAPSYTVDTLRELHQRLESSSYHLIIGADMFAEIQLWYKYSDLFELADIIVAARPGVSFEVIADQVAKLPGNFSFDETQQMWFREDGFKVFYCADVAESISSSEIRNLLAQGSSVTEYLVPSVLEYIQNNRIYSDH